MRPVVSSIVALAIAIAPFAAMASPEKSHKPVAAKVTKHHKQVEKTEKIEKTEKTEKSEKSEKSEKGDHAPISHVHHTGGKPGLKNVTLHHASGVDTSGAGHKEPKVEKGVTVVPATLQKPAHGKTAQITRASHKKAEEMPQLPNPNATKASKAGSEKGARKGSEKKNDEAADDGEPKRDEDSADLVARIRGKHASGASCTKDPIQVIRGPEIDTFPLTRCDGSVAPLAIEHLSILVRPGSAARPTAPVAELAKKKGEELAQGVHRVDEGLALRLQSLADHFGKSGAPIKLSIVSGYRPTSIGSMHATGRAVDFRIEGTKNEDIVAFCKTLADTGCGYYPNSSFVHVDVRDAGAGHVSWIDASGPGETPHYVSTWPVHEASSAPDKLEPASAKASAPELNCEETESVEEHPQLPK